MSEDACACGSEAGGPDSESDSSGVVFGGERECDLECWMRIEAMVAPVYCVWLDVHYPYSVSIPARRGLAVG